MTKQPQAYQKFVRTSARKLRLVADMVRRLPLEQAITQLQLARKMAAEPVKKLLIQARANAVSMGLAPQSLFIKSLLIEEGPTFKRFRAASRGRAHSILKRTSHLKVTLETNPKLMVKQTPAKSSDAPSVTPTKKGK